MTDTSRVADTCLSTADSSAGNANPEFNNDFPPKSEKLSHTDDVTAGDEDAVDVQTTINYEFPTGSAFDNGNTTREKCQEQADSSHSSQIMTPEDHKTELSKGTTEHANSRHISQTPLAFTIDFGNNKEVDTTKYQNLFERYNARHRRNLSMSKVKKLLLLSNLMHTSILLLDLIEAKMCDFERYFHSFLYLVGTHLSKEI